MRLTMSGLLLMSLLALAESVGHAAVLQPPSTGFEASGELYGPPAANWSLGTSTIITTESGKLVGGSQSLQVKRTSIARYTGATYADYLDRIRFEMMIPQAPAADMLMNIGGIGTELVFRTSRRVSVSNFNTTTNTTNTFQELTLPNASFLQLQDDTWYLFDLAFVNRGTNNQFFVTVSQYNTLTSDYDVVVSSAGPSAGNAWGHPGLTNLAATHIIYFDLSFGGDATSTYFIDNIMFSIPEPASVVSMLSSAALVWSLGRPNQRTRTPN